MSFLYYYNFSSRVTPVAVFGDLRAPSAENLIDIAAISSLISFGLLNEIGFVRVNNIPGGAALEARQQPAGLSALLNLTPVGGLQRTRLFYNYEIYSADMRMT